MTSRAEEVEFHHFHANLYLGFNPMIAKVCTMLGLPYRPLKPKEHHPVLLHHDAAGQSKRIKSSSNEMTTEEQDGTPAVEKRKVLVMEEPGYKDKPNTKHKNLVISKSLSLKLFDSGSEDEGIEERTIRLVVIVPETSPEKSKNKSGKNKHLVKKHS
jgi:hypothetical protein